jgi:hypothetical protein
MAKALHIAIFHREPTDEPPIFCGPEASQPRAAVTLPGGAVVEDAWLCDLPNLGALATLLNDVAAPVIIHEGRGTEGRSGRKCYVLEVVND